MTTPQLMRLLLPKSLASAGWDIVKCRRDVEGILFDDEDPPESLHPALRAVDGVALGHTHFGQAEIDAAPRLRVVGRIAEACTRMFRAHEEGKAICGTYSREEAQKKVTDILAFADEHNFPLKCILEEAD
jgi:hypothetical protein